MKLFSHKLTLLGLSQLINLSAPVISTLLLIDFFGSEVYGQYVYFTAIASLILTISCFSIQPMLLREHSSNNLDKYNKDIITLIQLAFYFLVCGITVLFLKKDQILLSGSILLCTSYNLFFQIWRYQIENKLRQYLIMTFFYKLIPILAIFLPMQKLGIEIFPLAQSVILIFLLMLHFRKLRVLSEVYPHKIIQNISIFRGGIALFLSQLSSQIYVYLPKIILGSSGLLVGVATFDIAEKLAKLLKQPIYVISQYILGESTDKKGFYFNFKKVSFGGLFIGLVLLVLTWSFNMNIFGFDDLEFRVLISLSLVNVFLVMITTFYCYIPLIKSHKDKVWLGVCVFGLISFIILLILYKIVGVESAVFMFSITTIIELLIFIYSYSRVYKVNAS